MSHKHVYLEVQDLCVEAEESGDTLMHYPVPLIILPFDGWCAEADAVAPVMPDLSNLVFEVISRCILVNFVRVLNEF